MLVWCRSAVVRLVPFFDVVGFVRLITLVRLIPFVRRFALIGGAGGARVALSGPVRSVGTLSRLVPGLLSVLAGLFRLLAGLLAGLFAGLFAVLVPIVVDRRANGRVAGRPLIGRRAVTGAAVLVAAIVSLIGLVVIVTGSGAG